MPANHDSYWKNFPPHTRLKHGILQAYLGAWARILSLTRRHRTIWFVDGFAGRGRDEQGREGSPVIACRMAGELERDLARRGLAGATTLRVIAVENVKDNVDALVGHLEPYADSVARPRVLEGSINDQYPQILAEIGDDPALFFLDPWGVDGLSAQMIRDMLIGDKHEILLLFSEESTHRLRGAVRSSPKKRGSEIVVDLFGETVRAKREVSTTYREADEEILNDVFAGLWNLVDQTADHNPGQERSSYLDSYIEIQRRLGAHFVLPMSVVDEQDQHKYSLIHASKHGKAMAAMKEALHTAMKRREESGALSAFHVTAPGLGRLCDQIAREFAGQHLRWQNGSDRHTVRRYVLEETWALMTDMEDIKTELHRRGYQASARPITYEFPVDVAAKPPG